MWSKGTDTGDREDRALWQHGMVPVRLLPSSVLPALSFPLLFLLRKMVLDHPWAVSDVLKQPLVIAIQRLLYKVLSHGRIKGEQTSVLPSKSLG